MKLKIFPSYFQITKWLKDKDIQIVDKHYTLEEFLDKIIIVDGKKFIDKDLRKKYLFEAIRNVDSEKLGISKKFINFLEDSDSIFSFFNDIFLERIEINNLINDVYLEYEEHLFILKEILKNYKALLEKDGYIDKFLIEEYRINKGLLEGIDEIELRLDEYLPKFYIEILKKVPNLKIYFDVDKFNKKLIEKSLDISVKENKRYVYDFKELKKIKKEIKNPQIEVEYFNDRLKEVEFVFAKIKEFVESGINPENIAVILPDEDFSELLELFDEQENLNFAMGKSFTKSNIYIKLKAIYDYLSGDSKAIKKFQDIKEDFEQLSLITLIEKYSTDKELEVIAEELFKLKVFEKIFKDKKDFLYFVLNRLKDKKFDDTHSGKITCIGVLESRGMEFDGVIIIDFNEEYVPNVSDKDLFLNTFIRKQLNLPTIYDKENFQKHYYYQLINNAKKVAISYVQNEESIPSKLLYEFDLIKYTKHISNCFDVYQYFNFSKEKNLTQYNEKFNIKEPIYPTTLKTLLECPKRYYFEKILKITSPSEDEFFGNIFHDSMKKIDNEKKFNNANEYYEKLIKEIKSRMHSKKLLFDFQINWEDKLKEFCKEDFSLRFGKRSMPGQIKTFDYKNFKLACKIDRIDEDESEIVLINYKTSKNDEDNEHYIYNFQTTFYYLWAKKNYPNKKIKTYIWDIEKVALIEGAIKIETLDEILKNLPKEVKEAEDIIVKYKNYEKLIKSAKEICINCPYTVACGKDEL